MPPLSEVELASKASSSRRVGFQVTFQNVAYSVASKTEKGKTAALLSNVTGYFNPGQLTALMGPSGSGKTTLLDVLAGRKTVGNVDGTIRYAGFSPTVSFLRRYTGYVEQFDNLLSAFTVREMITYTAELKRPVSESYDTKKAVVDKVMERLGLEDCQNLRIGNVLHRGISGGEAKRTNIGISIVSNPRVLFLDEPTSGLDSFTANEIMSVVKNLTSDGTTVCATVHSPTPYIFNLFDSVMVLIRGQTIYFGARGKAAPYFESLNTTRQTVHDSSEAEWITDIVVRSARNKTTDEMIEAYKKSDVKRKTEEEIAAMLSDTKSTAEDSSRLAAEDRPRVIPFWHSLKVLVKYRSLSNLRSPEFLLPRIAAKVVLIFLLSTVFGGIGDDYSTANFTNIGGLLFLWTILSLFTAVGYLPNLIVERPIFYRERADGLYRVLTYLIAKMLDEVVVVVVTTLMFGPIVFYATQLQGSLAAFLAIYSGNTLAGLGIAYAISAVAPTLDAAMAMAPAYMSTLILSAGFMIRLEDIPAAYRWYTHINFAQYALSALLINQYDTEGGRDLTLRVPDGNGGFKEMPMIEYYSLEDAEVPQYTGLIYVFFVAYFFLAFLAMQYCKYQKR